VSALHKLLSISDFEREAKRRLPKAIFEYVRGGTEDEVALVGNRAVFDQLVFRARGLRNVSARSQSVTVLGQTYASPFGFAPTGVNAIVCHDCDSKLAREAARSQTSPSRPWSNSPHTVGTKVIFRATARASAISQTALTQGV
jgi:isopentenyl diphosphate isomerase/L-lactate dehydrogenase-like FMN-dependent dehydrogenase